MFWLDMIHELAPVTNTFVSVPADMNQLNCAAFLAGIIAGILDSARFVSVHNTILNIRNYQIYHAVHVECPCNCPYCTTK